MLKQNLLLFSIIFILTANLSNAAPINEDTETPRMLIAAAERNYTDVINVMIRKGVNINLQDVNGNSALSTASENGNAELVKFLLSKGADRSQIKPVHHSPFVIPDIKDDYQAPEIYIYGVRWGMIEIVKSMLNRGIPVDTLDSQGNNALGTAAGVNQTDITAFLLEQGADINLINGIGLSPIEHAISNDGIDAAFLIYKKGVKSIKNESEWYVRQLFAFISGKNKSTDAKDPDTEMNLLMTSAAKNHPNTVQFLVKNGADINASYKSSQMRNRPLNGSTPLIFALRDKSGPDAAFELIRLRASLDNLNNSDESALLLAVYNADIAMATALLDAGANVNRADSFGHTPMYNARMNSDKEMMALLKKRGGK